ncbi:MAG TPA: VacJ family lipoprotein [Steroidobacteraceae bacterium]|jgi:phospholipid-binding lipoprotein MlaA
MNRSPRTLLVVALLAAAGCASLPPGAKPDPRDQFERTNRAIYKFNVAVDHAVLRPTARAYVKVVPQGARNSITNFMTNLTYTTTILNDFLQGQWRNGASDTARLVMNTLFGLGGLFDVATPSGLDRHDADFGQTLGRWGVHSGPYVMLPFLGPSTVRDSFGLLADEYTTPRAYITDPWIRWPLFTVDLVDHRAHLLDLDKYIDQSFDPYAFVRNTWLQRREYQIHPDKAESPEELLQGQGDEDLPPSDAPDNNAAPDKGPAGKAPADKAPAGQAPRAHSASPDAAPSGDAPTTR